MKQIQKTQTQETFLIIESVFKHEKKLLSKKEKELIKNICFNEIESNTDWLKMLDGKDKDEVSAWEDTNKMLGNIIRKLK